MISAIIQQETMSEAEQALIVEAFSNPTVKKYLRSLAQVDLAELATLSVTERDNSEVAKKHALVSGKLSTLATLLSINKPINKE